MTEYPETRIEFKRLLDEISAIGVEMIKIQEVMKNGNPRFLEVSSPGILLRLQSPDRTFHWDPQDPRTAVTSLVVTGEYEILETAILRKISEKSSLVVDIGANIGYYAVELGNALPNSATLIAFEPITQSYSQLVRNIELNEMKCKVIACKTAISNIDTEIDLFIPRVSGSSATSARNLHPREDFEVEKVPALRLDTYFRDNGITSCDLIKIDVEGAELFAIQGAENIINTYRPVIFAELLRKWSAEFSYHPNDVIKLLSEKGYTCFGVGPDFNELEGVDDETMETNFMFVHTNQRASIMKLIEEVREECK